MIKQLPKTARHVPGLALGAPPPEFQQQQDRLANGSGQPPTVAGNDAPAATPPPLPPPSKPARPLQRVTLTCRSISLVLTLPVYAVDVREKVINLQVLEEFDLSSEEKLSFTLETDGKRYAVVFLGVTVDFPGCHAVVFVRTTEQDQLNQT